MSPRKSPIFHHVRNHTRDGHSVGRYERGHGKAPRSSIVSRDSSLIHKPRVRRIQTREERLTKLHVGAKSRKEWIQEMWEWKHKGAIDFNINAQTKKIPKSNIDYRVWQYQKKQPYMDLIDEHGFDRSRKDVMKFKSPSGTNVYVGSGSKNKRRILGLNARLILRNNFTIAEVKSMGRMFFEASNPRSALGTCWYHPRMKASYMGFKAKTIDHEKVVTHEVIHAYRFRSGLRTRDRNTEEKITELETMCRVSENAIRTEPTHGGGYYQYIVPKKDRSLYWSNQAEYNRIVREAMLSDRKIILGDLKSRKGVALRNRIREHYGQTQIAKVHFSSAELLDRSFVVKDDGILQDIHVRYEFPTSLAQIKKEFIEDFGKDVEVWEWRDGKKIKILAGLPESDPEGFRIFAGKRFEGIAPFYPKKVDADERANGIKSQGDFARVTKHNKGYVVWRRYRKVK